MRQNFDSTGTICTLKADCGMMLIKLDNGVWWEEKMALFVLINQAINNPPYLRSPSRGPEGSQNKLIHTVFDSNFCAY